MKYIAFIGLLAFTGAALAQGGPSRGMASPPAAASPEHAQRAITALRQQRDEAADSAAAWRIEAMRLEAEMEALRRELAAAKSAAKPGAGE